MTPTLKKLQNLLKVERSAKDIAHAMSSSIPTAYRRINSLREAGAVLQMVKRYDSGKTGPTPAIYRILKVAP